jgi:hypothetical protein
MKTLKKFHSEKNLPTFSLDLDPDPELDPDLHASKRLDPDPDSHTMYADPKHWSHVNSSKLIEISSELSKGG